ncbi:uncharacterized protein LOC107273236 isoform X2 [Cephus cinctus]|nr:uncharacterized protein LOC107273236 isoform X2 [Cephus cinctus]XP_024946473.1 uncharacterized protein LOC107273236 isoform X2 [Cephus cinctus]
MSFSSSFGMGTGSSLETQGQRRLGVKVDVVYSLLGMLGSTEGREDMSATLLSMTSSVDSCLAMRQSGCLPLLVQLIHAPDQDPDTRSRASQALHNVIHARSDERAARREVRVLRLLEQLRDYCQMLRKSLKTGQIFNDEEKHPGPSAVPTALIAALMKLSFDEAHRHAMCQLGGLHAMAELIEMDHAAHGNECDDPNCVTLRRYAGMALTNLTFGDGNNKALLCSFRAFMKSLVTQLRSNSDDLRQVTASVLRNLSWRADSCSKKTLREVGSVTGLTKAAMEGRKESTLKSILSALWNLSAHCSTNKADICAVEGALAFLVDMLSYKAPSKTLTIVENAGGILRNVSSHVAIREDYREILRERGCLHVLLRQLRSPSLTVVSNACGALWNLSARCSQDQRLLWDLGAVPMLRSLVHSKHKMISMGSSAALKNLIGARPSGSNLVHLDSTARGLGFSTLPSLVARRQRALEQELDQNLAETCDNIEPSTSPINKGDKFSFKVDRDFVDITGSWQPSYGQTSSTSIIYNGVDRSESRESIHSAPSAHSDTVFQRVNGQSSVDGISSVNAQIKQQCTSLPSPIGFDVGQSTASFAELISTENKYSLRYKCKIPDHVRSSNIGSQDIGDQKFITSTMSWSTSAPDQASECSHTLLQSSIGDTFVNQESKKGGGGTKVYELRPDVSSNSKMKDYLKSCYDISDNEPVASTLASTTTSINKNLRGAKLAVSDIKSNDKLLQGEYVALVDNREKIGFTEQHAAEYLFDANSEASVIPPIEYDLLNIKQSVMEKAKQSQLQLQDEVLFAHEINSKIHCKEGKTCDALSNYMEVICDADLQSKQEAEIKFHATEKQFADIQEGAHTIEKSGSSLMNSKIVHTPIYFNDIENAWQELPNSGDIHYTKSLGRNAFKIQNQNEEMMENGRAIHKNELSTEYSIKNYVGKAIATDGHFSGNHFSASKKFQEPDSSNTQTIELLSPLTQKTLIERQMNESQNNVNVISETGMTDLICQTSQMCLASPTMKDKPKIVTKHKEPELKLSDNHTERNVSKEASITATASYNVSGGNTDKKDLLTTCLSTDVQNNRGKQLFRKSSIKKMQRTSNLARYETRSSLDRVENADSIAINREPVNHTKSKDDMEIRATSFSMNSYCQDFNNVEYETMKFNTELSNIAKNDEDSADCYKSKITLVQPNIQFNNSSLPFAKTAMILTHIAQEPECKDATFGGPSLSSSNEYGVMKLLFTCKASEENFLGDTAFETAIVNATCVQENHNQVNPPSFKPNNSIRSNLGPCTSSYFIKEDYDNTLPSSCKMIDIKTHKNNGLEIDTINTSSKKWIIAPTDQDTANLSNSRVNDLVERSEQTLLKLCIRATDGIVLSNTEDKIGDSDADYTLIVPAIKESPSVTGKVMIDQDKILLKEMNSWGINKTSSDEQESVISGSKYYSIHGSRPIDNIAISHGGISKETLEKEYKRQRDPDAMIASLDRLTAALVQETEAMRERDSIVMKQSVVSDTWNEDSPNDISYPSISVSPPLVASFKSETQDEQFNSAMWKYVRNNIGEQSNMSDSKIIQTEAIKLAKAATDQAKKQVELNSVSMTSVDLDTIKPPSSMGSLLSLTSSCTGIIDNTEAAVGRDLCQSTSLPPIRMKTSITECPNARKKSLPTGLVAKRALSHGQHYTGSLENILNEYSINSNTQLENVKPPSMMDELFDVGDMENSMVSVASITSEVADMKEQDLLSLSNSDTVFDLLKPVANVLSMTCMRYAESMQLSTSNSLSDCLENINPPSLFNEVSEMDESIIDGVTHTLFSDTLCIDTELQTDEMFQPISVTKVDGIDNDTDNAATSTPTEYCISSSPESMQKKRFTKSHLTPKQKRQLAKERYKTYTIAAEMVKKEGERKKQEFVDNKVTMKFTGKCSPFSKLTPRQRRQEDKARFQTQVLCNSLIAAMQNTCIDVEQRDEQKYVKQGDEQKYVESLHLPETIKSSAFSSKSIIPIFKKSEDKTKRQRHVTSTGNKEQHHTKTLSEIDYILSGLSSGSTTNIATTNNKICEEEILNISSDEMEIMLKRNANIVLSTLRESDICKEAIGHEPLLDCETLSLVSNDSESERSLRMQVVDTIHKKLINSSISQASTPGSFGFEMNKNRMHAIKREIQSPALKQDDDGRDCSLSEENDEFNRVEEQPRIVKGPRILKPDMRSRDNSLDSSTTEKSDAESCKAIRGKRKTLYSTQTIRKSTPQPSPFKTISSTPSGIPIGRSNTSSTVRSTRAIILRQNNKPPNCTSRGFHRSKTNLKTSLVSENMQKQKRSIDLTANKNSILPTGRNALIHAKSIKHFNSPQTSGINLHKETPKQSHIKPLERQGTFTKDEPEVKNAPTVLPPMSPSYSKIAKPIKNSSSATCVTGGKSKISIRTVEGIHQSNISKVANVDKKQSSKGILSSTMPKRQPARSSIGGMAIPQNNRVIQTSNRKSSIRNVSLLGQRSNSNSSILSNSSHLYQGRQLIRDASSNIGSLSKKVEQNKNKQCSEKPDIKQWIPSAETSTEVDVSIMPNKPQNFRIIRSSTFEGIPQDTIGSSLSQKPNSNLHFKNADVQANKMKYRNSCDLSGMRIADAPCKIQVKYAESKPNKKDHDLNEDDVIEGRKQQNTQKRNEPDSGVTKRLSRLGSFISVESSESGLLQTYAGAHNSISVCAPTSAVVLPFNFNLKQDISFKPEKINLDNSDGKMEKSEYAIEINTESMKVTAV